jgi:hypothetical protein
MLSKRTTYFSVNVRKLKLIYSVAGWAIAADEREWIYRMSIFYIKEEDSGEYSCTTPKGMRNTIDIRVEGMEIFQVHVIVLNILQTVRITTPTYSHTVRKTKS